MTAETLLNQLHNAPKSSVMDSDVSFLEAPLICSWSLVSFRAESGDEGISVDREGAADLHRNLTEFLGYLPSAS